jgi:signal transduction protein with GAF and PtsI domain
VARDYVRGLGGAPDEALRDRALELEALVARLLDRLDAPGAPALAPGRLLVAHRLTVCEAVELAMRHGVGAALAGPAAASPGAQVARALGLPVVCDLAALFQWAADGDRALIDGDAGQLILNPSRADEAAFRRSAPRP